ncbi:zinc transporter 1-like [Ctenocephalides felis]|uniref:zinc transporter 1-like n=1 Tax=Ctenocephalides felis TaxID=7515 RepID=UPI000E6E1311|nr:zinc transporter 1-like [Ctenocephalides felis]
MVHEELLSNNQSEYGDRCRGTGFDTPVVLASSGEDLTSAKSSDKKNEANALSSQRTKHERSLKNTFGWARVDVIVTTMVCVFLASLCFSLLVEAVQTLIHIDHQDPMHHPIPVLCVGGAGLVVNGLCYLLIGGYTFHQGSYLQMTPTGDVVLDRAISGDRRGKKSNEKQNQQKSDEDENKESKREDNTSGKIDREVEAIVSKSGKIKDVFLPRRQGGREIARDVMSSVFVIICSLFVYWTDPDVAKYVDPVISIISCLCLLWLSYPYMKESSLILLQTIPASIDIDTLKANLLEAFPDIVNVHELHIWQLTANKIVSTAHIVFQNPEDYGRITNEIADFFTEQGITQATIQPEFSTSQKSCIRIGEWTRTNSSNNYFVRMGTDRICNNRNACLMRCPGSERCRANNCCGTSQHDSHRGSRADITGPYKRGSSSLVSIKVDDKQDHDKHKEVQINVLNLKQKYDLQHPDHIFQQISKSTENIITSTGAKSGATSKNKLPSDEEKLISNQYSKSMIDVHSFRADVKNILKKNDMGKRSAESDINDTTDVTGHVTDVKRDATDVTGHVTDVKGHAVNVTDHVTGVKSDAANVTGHVTDVTGHATYVTGHAGNVTGHVTDVKSHVTDVKSDATDVTGHVIDVKSDVIDVKSDATDVTGHVTDFKSDATDVKGHVTQVKSDKEQEMQRS